MMNRCDCIIIKLFFMKKLQMLGIGLFMALLSQAQFTKADLQATGLTCAMCSNAIYKALQQLPFVEKVKVDIKNSTYTVSFKKETVANIDALKNAVEDAGFSVGGLTLSGNFENLKVANDEHVTIGNATFHFLAVKDQTLSGEQTIRIVDKDFLTAKQFKKFSAATKMKCVQTGKAEGCCTQEGIPAGTRIYHVTI